MDGDNDIQVVYEYCNNETWKSARDRIKRHRTVGQSTGFNRSTSKDYKSFQAGYGRSQMYREAGETSSLLSYPSCFSAMPSASSEFSFASSAATQLDPLAAKVEVIDLVDATDEDSNSVEFLQEDSDSTTSGQTVRECTGRSEQTEEIDGMPLFFTKTEHADSDEDNADSREELVNLSRLSQATTMDIKGEEDEEDADINIFTPSPTEDDVDSEITKSEYTRSAAAVWREACRSSLSSCSVEEEKPPVFPSFSSTYSSVSAASSLARDVVDMRIDADSRRQISFPSSPPHDEVSSSSDVVTTKMPTMRTSDAQRELSTVWAEYHDLGLDGDEFLETEDEALGSPGMNQMEAEIVEITSEKPTNRKERKSRKSPHPNLVETTGSTEKTKRRMEVTIDATAEKDNDNLRKRSSSKSRYRSNSRSKIQSSKRFAAGRNRERPAQRFGYVRSGPPICFASSSPKAEALPRYVPVERRYDFTRWLDAKGELVLHKIKDVATGLVSAPLGCTYDSALDTFIFTRYDSILFATSEGRILNDLTLKGFNCPSAVCVLRPGQALGILDRSNLYLYEHHMKRLSILATGLCARHRALTYSNSGDFVTVRRTAGQLAITVFDGTSCDSIIASLPYPRADGVPNEQVRQPCFADTVGKQLFFTDLRTNTLTCVELTKDSLEKVYSRCLQQMPIHKDVDAQQRFSYMSGIRCDDSGHLLVADAKARSLKLLTSSGQFMKKARIADGSSFPYCSSFGISPSGLLMACDRANSRMVLYRIGEETAPEGAILTNDIFDRMIGKNGVENEIRRLKEATHRFS